MDDTHEEQGLGFVLRLLLGTAIGALAAVRIYTCVNLIEAGACESRDWMSLAVSVLILALAVKFLAVTLSE